METLKIIKGKYLPLLLALAVVVFSAAAISVGAPFLAPEAAELARGGVFITLMRALMFNAFLFFVLRSFDLMCSINVKRFIYDARSGFRDKVPDNRSVGIYLAARVLAVAIGNGMVFS